ncbi:Dopamine/Ecdysteroid receptor [Aphelenchoides bicaudatus]|nr:Dopamine/Ecdysteroid receptor [Aphelenchoides bicaudatus]
MLLDASNLSADVLTKAAVIFCVLILLLFSSITTIYVVLRHLRDATNFYIVSLAFSDLLWASFIVPLSVYSSLVPGWNFMGDNSILCKSSAYLQIVIMTSTMYIFSWLSVDRYSAFMKPSRYDSDHTPTRSVLWVFFTWLTALLGSIPALTKMEANYYNEFELCVLNWSSATAYSITLAVLVIVPSLCTIIFTTVSIFLAMRKPEELEDVQRSAIETDHNFVVTLFVVISFFLAWLPIIVLHFLPETWTNAADIATMKFTFVWLGIGCCSVKFLIYIFINRDFRQNLCICFNRDDFAAVDENFSTRSHQRLSFFSRIFCFCCPQKPPAVQRQRYGRSDTTSNSQLHSFRTTEHDTARNLPSNSYGYYHNGGTNLATKPLAGSQYAGYGTLTKLPPGF